MELASFWCSGDQRVLSLVGIGGCGKTAIASRFLQQLISDMQPKPAGVFVWSFYVDQNCSNFLREAYRYFSDGQDTQDTGVNLICRLAALLDDGRPHLIALDGLERVQREGGDGHGLFGQLEEALLRQLVTRFAVGVGKAKLLITTRFPVIDLDPWRGRSYLAMNLDNLDRDSARQLLRSRGVVGTDPRLNDLLDGFGTHALTTDHLGIYLARFHGGDPAWAMVAPEPSEEFGSAQERKLRRILKGYQKVLTIQELAVMQFFCMFRFGASPSMVRHLAAAPSDSMLLQQARDLSENELITTVDHLLTLTTPGTIY